MIAKYMEKIKRFASKHQRQIALGGIFVAALALFFLASAAVEAISVSAAAKGRELPIYSVKKEEKVAALSFDAAWGADDTASLVQTLNKYGVKATFFVVGKWAEKYPDAVKLISDAGHQVMNHSYDHAHFPKLTPEQMVENVNKASSAIEKVTGVRPNLFRAPYGDYDNATIVTLRNAGYYTIQWDVDSLDWKDLSASEITERVMKGVKPGSIVLFHNDAKHTPEALPGIIEKLQADGYRLVLISDLIYKNDYTIDHTGKQIPNS